MIIANYLLKFLPSYPPHGANYRTIFLLWLRLQAARWLWNSFEICSELFKSVTAIGILYFSDRILSVEQTDSLRIPDRIFIEIPLTNAASLAYLLIPSYIVLSSFNA